MPRRFRDEGQKPDARVAAWKRAHEKGVAGRLCDYRTRDERDAAPLMLVIRSGARRISDFPLS